MGFFGFSFKRMFGVTRLKTKAARTIGMPLTKTGRAAKVGRKITDNK